MYLYLVSERKMVTEIAGVLGVVLGAVASFTGMAEFYRAIRERRRIQEQVNEAEQKSEAEPDRLRPAWVLARITLEEYFNRNLRHVSWIFWLAVLVMMVGFGLVLYGIDRSVTQPNAVPIAIVAASAGIITEFIGGTFMLMYRSTLSQASSYMAILERINSVGMPESLIQRAPWFT